MCWGAGVSTRLVDNTGFVVVVQTPYDVLQFEARFGGKLVIWVCLSAIPGGLVMVFAAWHRRRRRRVR